MALSNDLNAIVQKFSEHYHDAWAVRKMENGWVYGDSWSDSQRAHPRLKPYLMLNDYVSQDYFNINLNILRAVKSSLISFVQVKNINYIGIKISKGYTFISRNICTVSKLAHLNFNLSESSNGY